MPHQYFRRNRPRPVLNCHSILLSLAALLFSIRPTFAQNTLDKAGLSAANPAAAAYSTRLLSSSYAGKALQVQRSSDNTTHAIGFTANGDLDTASLLTFVGAGNGFVSVWYDQSGNGLNLTQATAADQPQLVSAGVIQRENSQPFFRFFGIVGSGAYNALFLAADMTTVGHVSAVHRFAAGGDGFILSHTSDYYWHSNPPNYLINSSYASTSVQSGSAWSNGNASTPDLTTWPTVLTLDELEPATPGTTTTWNNLGTDRITDHNLSGGAGYAELILFTAALPTAARQALENNEMGYFGIVILPLTWLSFTAQLQGGQVQLQWQTAFEQNTSDFTVQSSRNGAAWTNLAILPAAGNSNSTRTYTYSDPAPTAGNNGYRILENDLDGNNNYSEVRVVVVDKALPAFTVLTNPPGGGYLQVVVNSLVTLSLYSSDGQMLWQQSCQPGIQSIDVSRYAAGIYFLRGRQSSIAVLLP